MSFYIPQGVPPVLTNSMARVERRLPHPGEVLARVGGRVEPEDVIARTLKPAPPLIINVSRQLGIPPHALERAMYREVGNRVAQGEKLASTGRLGGRSCLAPISGMIAAVDTETGYVTLAPDPTSFDLVANVRGLVMEVLPYEGVIIETLATQAFGVVGFGDERNGVLRLLSTDPSDVVTPDKITTRDAYAILICGAGITAAALKRAVSEQVRGIIVGGIDEAELRTFFEWSGIGHWQIGQSSWQLPDPRYFVDPKLTIVLTEGFGVQPMAQPIYDALSANDRQEAMIEGFTSLRRPLRRPRVIVPQMRGGSAPEMPRVDVRVGAKVRLLDPEHLGQIAQVRSAPNQVRRLTSGVRAIAVEVVLPGQSPFWVPRTALEVME